MESTSFMRVDEVAQELGISKSYAYNIVQKLNAELKEKGFICSLYLPRIMQIFLCLVIQKGCWSLSAKKKIDVAQGNIDRDSTHKQIVDIMEDGKEAFDKRQLIYASWR